MGGEGDGVGLHGRPARPGADILGIAGIVFINELDAHGQGGGTVGLRGGEAEDLLDEAVELEAGLVGVAGEQAVGFGLGQGALGGAVAGFDFVFGIRGGVEQELGNGIGREVGEDEEPEAGVGIQLLKAGLPGDENGAGADFLRPGVGDEVLFEPAEEVSYSAR